MLQVLRQFRVLVRALRRHNAAVESRAGIGGAQLWALAEIAEGGELSMGELARQMAIHASTASNLARVLLARKLVGRSRASHDRRVICLRPTAAGRRVLARAPRPLEGLLQGALLQLSPRRLESLHGDLGALLEIVGENGGEGETILSELTARGP